MRQVNQNQNQNQNKRMRGRGRKAPSLLSRSFESNGPDVKVRGTAMHIAEKYQQLARDAHVSGDRIMAENYYQHAEHYSRLVAAAQPQGEVSQGSQDNQSGDDDDDRDDRDVRVARSGRDGRESDRGRFDGNQGDNGNRSESVSVAETPVPSRARPVEERSPVMPEDAPQPFIEGMPNTNTKRAELNGSGPVKDDPASEASTPDGEEEVAKPRRRTRGTRGRGTRRPASADAGEGELRGEPATDAAPESSDA